MLQTSDVNFWGRVHELFFHTWWGGRAAHLLAACTGPPGTSVRSDPKYGAFPIRSSAFPILRVYSKTSNSSLLIALLPNDLVACSQFGASILKRASALKRTSSFPIWRPVPDLAGRFSNSRLGKFRRSHPERSGDLSRFCASVLKPASKPSRRSPPERSGAAAPPAAAACSRCAPARAGCRQGVWKGCVTGV